MMRGFFFEGIVRLGAGLLLCGGLAGLPAQAQRVAAVASADSVTVGERFYLTLLIDHAAVERPRLPDEAPAEVDSVTGKVRLGDLELIRQVSRARRALAAGMMRDSVVYEVTTFALDTAFVPPIPVELAAEGDTATVFSEPLQVFVTSLVPPDAADIRDLAPLVDFPRPLWPWMLLGGVLLMLVGLLVYSRRQRPSPAAVPVAPPPAPLSPFEEAVQRLQHLERIDLSVPEAIKPFYVDLSETLRRYLSRRLGVAALEHTTRELVHDLHGVARQGRLKPELPEAVREILELADFAKFADARPPVARGKEALRRARATVQAIELQQAHAMDGQAGVEAPPAPAGPASGAPPGATNGRARHDGPSKRRRSGRVTRPIVYLLAGVTVAGGVLAWGYSGPGAALPFVLALAVFVAIRPFVPADRRPWLETLSVQAGLYAWLLGGYVWAPDLVAHPGLASAEVVLAVAGLAGLMIRPGRLPAGLLGLLQLGGLGLLLLGEPAAVAAPPAVEGGLRLLALATLGLGLRAGQVDT